jgi:hypothetical protein
MAAHMCRYGRGWRCRFWSSTWSGSEIVRSHDVRASYGTHCSRFVSRLPVLRWSVDHARRRC